MTVFYVPCHCGSRRFNFGWKRHGDEDWQSLVHCAECGAMTEGAIFNPQIVSIRHIDVDYPEVE